MKTNVVDLNHVRSGSSVKRVTCILPDDLHRALKVYAVTKDTTLIALIEQAVRKYVVELDHNCKNVRS